MMQISDIFIGSTIVLALSQTVTGFMVSNRSHRIETLETQIAVQASNNKQYLHSLSIQNKAVTDLRVDLNISMERWDNRVLAVTVVDKWHTKYVDRNITIERQDCEDTLLVLDAIRANGF